MYRNRQASYLVTAHQTPPALSQIAGLLAIGGHVPVRLRSRHLGSKLMVDIDVASLSDAEAELLATQLQRLSTVLHVRLEQVEGQRAA